MSYCKRFAAALLTVAIVCISSIASAQDDFAHWDYGSNREYVPAYFRLAPYGKIYDKWSTFGNINPLHPNVNPYSRNIGTSIPPPSVVYVPTEPSVVYVPTEASTADVPTEESITPPPGRDLSRSAPPADRLKSRVRTYTNRPNYQIRFEPNTFGRP
jgi:hypothetical protein